MSKGTPHRCFRVEDELYHAALRAAKGRDEKLSDIVRAALREYVETKGEK